MNKRAIAALLAVNFLPHGYCEVRDSSTTSPTSADATKPAPPVRKRPKDTAAPLPCGAAPPGTGKGNPYGINVTHLETYDDSTLQQQLDQNFLRLSSLSGFDQASLTKGIGNVSGIDQSFLNTSLNVGGPATAQTVNTATVPVTNTLSKVTATTDGNGVPVGTTPITTENDTTKNGATDQLATTRNSMAPPAANLPAAPTAVTSGTGVQSQAILTEQVQLASRLSTEVLKNRGPLSGRMLTYEEDGSQITLMRPRLTVGAVISAAPTSREKDKAAVVEAIISNCGEVLQAIAPSVDALLPDQVTYNTASVRNTSTNLGGGFATMFLGASGGIGFGRNSYFLVQEQDTSTEIFDPTPQDRVHCPGDCVGIRWTFRPVLGKRIVNLPSRLIAGQFGFPVDPSQSDYGQLFVRTYWKHYDRKNGIINGKPENQVDLYTVPLRPLRPEKLEANLNVSSINDLGNGQLMVSIEGGFPLGTAVQVGSTILSGPSTGLLLGTNMLSFAASTSDLIAKNSFLVFPSGERQPLVMIDPHDIQPAAGTPQISTLDATYSRVEVKYCEHQNHLDSKAQIAALDEEIAALNNHPVLLIGGKGYGFSDAPLERQSTAPIGAECAGFPSVSGSDIRERTVAITLPTSTLLSSPSIVLKRLLGDVVNTKRFSLIGNKTFSPLSQTDRLVLLKQTGDGAEFLLYGSRLKSIKTEPTVTLTPISQGPPLTDSSNDLVYVSLTTDQLKQYKFIVLIRPNEAPEALQIPTLPPADESKTKDDGPKISDTVLVDQNTATVMGKGLQDLQKVQFRGIAIAFKAAKDGNSATLKGLRQAGVTGQASLQSIDFFFKPKPIQVKVDVFTQKSQTVARP